MERKVVIIASALAVVVVIGAIFATLSRPETSPATPVLLDPAAATYVIDGTTVTLSAGRADTAIGNVALFGTPAHGDIDGDGREDAAVILTADAGGSGTMFYAGAVLAREGEKPLAAVFVGDRIAPQGVSVRGGIVSLAYADRYPWEPFATEPHIGKEKRLTLTRGMLVDVPAPTLDDAAARALAVERWGDCDSPELTCAELSVRVLDGKDGAWYVEAIYDGLPDDSIRAERHVASVFYADGWHIGQEVVQDWKCRDGRGHTDFSSALCI
jgi:hypothetical protein